MWGKRNTDWAQACAVVGGMLILLEAALTPSIVFYPLFAFGVVAGLVLIGAGVALGGRSRNRTSLGVLILLVSLASFFGDSGYFLGALLGLVGGLLAVTSRGVPFQNPVSSLYAPPSFGMPCGRCGKPVPSWTTTCPYCGFPER